jgi:methylthioribose-1-phosphate isomerase
MQTAAIIFENDQLTILDQTLLPHQLKYIAIHSVDQCVESIKHLRVRGAPAIGIITAYVLYLAANELSDKNYDIFKESMDESCQILFESRPTAVNLGWAIKRMQAVYHSNHRQPPIKIASLLKSEAIKIHLEDKEACYQIGRNGLAVVPNPANILTHCNTGSLATGGWGTALGIIYAAQKQNYNIHVYVDETRPLGQGARLTFWELMHNNVPCTLITASAAGSLMKEEKIDLVLFGADRIAKNGDVANKIGSYSLAVLARFHGIPCYAVAPSSTIDLSTKSGNEIEIELRNSQEILHIYGYNDNLLDVADIFNPAFDITPADFLSGIITEKGIINSPINNQISEIFNINT